MRLRSLMFLLLLAAACSRPDSSGPLKVRVPMDDGQGNYPLQTVELTTVTNLESMEGSSAVIKNRAVITQYLSGEGTDEHVIEARFKDGFKPKARFLKSSGVYFPSDSESLLMTSTMVQFERLKIFFDKLGATRGISFPQRAYVQSDIVFKKGDSSFVARGNASFYTGEEFFMFNQQGEEILPVAYNTGIIAHEYTHSIFNALTKNILDRSLYVDDAELWNKPLMEERNITADYISQDCSSSRGQFYSSMTLQKETFRKTNAFVLSSLNEAIADYFAYEFTSNAKYILPSYPNETIRDLTTGKQLNCSDETVKGWAVDILKRPGAEKARKFIDPHNVGTFFSHFLYLTAMKRKKNGDNLTTAIEVIRFIPLFATEFNASIVKQKKFSLVDAVVNYFEINKPTLESCESAAAVFPQSTSLKTICKKVLMDRNG